MKNLFWTSLICMGVCLSTFAMASDCSLKSKCKPSIHNQYVIDLNALTSDELNEIMRGHHREIVIKFSAHTVLPIKFFLKGDLIKLIESDEKLRLVEVQQTFYACYVEDEFLLSSDLSVWKHPLEYITGSASISISIQDGSPSIEVGTEANRRC